MYIAVAANPTIASFSSGPGSPPESSTSQDGDERDQFIPVRKSVVLDALIEHGRLASGETREQFAQFCRLLAAIVHYQYFEWLEKLRDDYYYFNPDGPVDAEF